jgi:ribonucleoside-diphosphate reductase beta chain
MDTKTITRRPVFNEFGDITLDKRRMIGGNTTNLNDFNNIKYSWSSDWYRQAMNNFWVPEEINMNTDIQDYRKLDKYEKEAYDKVLSFLIFLDSVQSTNVPNVSQFITANEVNLCLTIQAFQEAVHSQSYGYMLDTICAPEERTKVLYQWKDDTHLLERNKYIGNIYNEFQENPNSKTLLRSIVANYILEGVYFYSGFMFFYNLGRNNKMPGSVQEIRYINRDENTHLWLFRSILLELKEEEPQMFTPELIESYRDMIKTGCEMEIAWGHYIIGDNIAGLNKQMITDYIQYLGNLRCTQLGFTKLYEGHDTEPEPLQWVSQYANANLIKTDFFEAKSTAYAKSSALVDDL